MERKSRVINYHTYFQRLTVGVSKCRTGRGLPAPSGLWLSSLKLGARPCLLLPHLLKLMMSA
jgi:hypothetical protein